MIIIIIFIAAILASYLLMNDANKALERASNNDPIESGIDATYPYEEEN